MNERKHVDAYDWLRVIAIILVVIGHSSYLSISTYLGGVDYEIPSTLNGHYDDWIFSTLRYLSGWVYQFHMPLFFMLSGAVFAIAKEESFDNLFRKKVKRLFVPYYVYGFFFMFPLKYWAGFYEKDNLRVAMRSFFQVSECGHLWFLPVLFWCFIFFYLIKRTVGIRSLYVPFVMVFILWQIMPDITNGYFGITESLQYLIWFIAGYIFEKERQEKQREFKIRTALCKTFILTLLVVATSGILMKPDDFMCVLMKAYWIYGIAEILANTVGKNVKIKNGIRTLAGYSFYIYIFHDPLEYAVLKLAFRGDWLSSGLGVYFYFFARTILVYLASLLLGLFIVQIKKHMKNRFIGEKNAEH